MTKKRIEEECMELLLDNDLTLTTAESCTGGMVASRIVNVPNASWVLMQGLVTYSNEAKERYLGVSHETLKKFGPVSEETAREMALGAVRVAGTDVGIATTGLAGPGGGTRKKPVGLVYVACCIREKVRIKKLKLSGSREEIRTKATEEALTLLYETLTENMEN